MCTFMAVLNFKFDVSRTAEAIVYLDILSASEWQNLAVHLPSHLPLETNKDATIPTNFRGYLHSKCVVYTKRQFIYTNFNSTK